MENIDLRHGEARMNHPELGEGAFEWLGTWYKTVLHTDASGGVISITDSIGLPGSGPPRHVHHDADETFVMLTGQAQFWLDGTLVQRGAGETVFVPRGKEHTFRVIGKEASRHLVIMTPGGFEGFFAEMASGQCRIPEDMDKIVKIAARYHLTFTGPPLDPA
jgi:quercetin dioxygenase-like cupin family protein